MKWHTTEIPEPEGGVIQKSEHQNPETKAHFIMTSFDVYYLKDAHIEQLSKRTQALIEDQEMQLTP